MNQYLFSRSFKQSPDPAIELVSSDPVTFVRELKQRSGKDIWLCGGGDLATVLFPAIDEMILKVHPFLLGSGIPLFSETIPLTSLQLTSLQLTGSKIYKNGFMLLHYRVNH